VEEQNERKRKTGIQFQKKKNKAKKLNTGNEE
jgi:hypothetical protein